LKKLLIALGLVLIMSIVFAIPVSADAADPSVTFGLNVSEYATTSPPGAVGDVFHELQDVAAGIGMNLGQLLKLSKVNEGLIPGLAK
jgi:hypothetical protein